MNKILNFKELKKLRVNADISVAQASDSIGISTKKFVLCEQNKMSFTDSQSMVLQQLYSSRGIK